LNAVVISKTLKTNGSHEDHEVTDAHEDREGNDQEKLIRPLCVLSVAVLRVLRVSRSLFARRNFFL
jgi:hypothetical protein